MVFGAAASIVTFGFISEPFVYVRVNKTGGLAQKRAGLVTMAKGCIAFLSLDLGEQVRVALVNIEELQVHSRQSWLFDIQIALLLFPALRQATPLIITPQSLVAHL